MTTTVRTESFVIDRVIDAPPIAYWNSNAYAVDCSPDGTRLAIGSGGWYGGGGITLVDLASGDERTLRFAKSGHPDNAPWPWGDSPLTVSGVRFDATGRYLALSAWRSAQHYAPAFLCRVHGLTLEHVATFAWRDSWEAGSCPTGVCFGRGRLHVRNNARQLETVFRSFALPRDVDTSSGLAHRTHARVALVGRKLVTGGGGSLKLAAWVRNDVLIDEGAPTEVPVSGAWATYRPESIVGLCRRDDEQWFSVDAAGRMAAWRGRERTHTFALPRPGTPRAIAVHPDTPAGCLLAVAVKAGDSDRRGYVACFRVPAVTARD